MLSENKNLTDSSTFAKGHLSNLSQNSVSGGHVCLSYTKTNKLVAALYMVTDIMDKQEPLRNKLRILGAGIVSDIHSNPVLVADKISEILSFLDITSAVGMISEMNCNILKKEFFKLEISIQEFAAESNPVWLEKFIQEEKMEEDFAFSSLSIKNKLNVDNSRKDSAGYNVKGHALLETKPNGHSTRIGVQKGSTLMNALKKMEGQSFSNHVRNTAYNVIGSSGAFDQLKKQRRDEIVKIIKDKKGVYPTSGGATITDIRTSAKGVLVSCGEKTLQRELVSMVSDGVLNKTGEKRWSKYFLK